MRIKTQCSVRGGGGGGVTSKYCIDMSILTEHYFVIQESAPLKPLRGKKICNRA